MPENPEREGRPRLLTVPEITEKHGISRQTIHAYRQRGIFPKPAPEQGSTRLRFREDEVDAFVAANPKRPGRRRRVDRETPTEGEPVTVLDQLTEVYGEAGRHEAEAQQLAAELLGRHAHDLAEKLIGDDKAADAVYRPGIMWAAEAIDPQPDEEDDA